MPSSFLCSGLPEEQYVAGCSSMWDCALGIAGRVSDYDAVEGTVGGGRWEWTIGIWSVNAGNWVLAISLMLAQPGASGKGRLWPSHILPALPNFHSARLSHWLSFFPCFTLSFVSWPNWSQYNPPLTPISGERPSFLALFSSPRPSFGFTCPHCQLPLHQ